MKRSLLLGLALLAISSSLLAKPAEWYVNQYGEAYLAVNRGQLKKAISIFNQMIDYFKACENRS